MNESHTIADVRSFIHASRPGEAGRSFVLQTSFPPKELKEEGLSLKEAGLLNAVVVQKRV
jgi:hypothetical protein